MNVFQFEQQIKKEHNQKVNLIYINSNGNVYLTTINGSMELSEVKKGNLITYDSVDELIKKSKQLKKYSTFMTLVITINGTDAAKWENKELVR